LTRLVSSVLAAAVVALFLSPIGFFGDTHTGTSEGLAVGASAPMPVFDELVFSGPIDTSIPIPEYTMVSRALMLNGGSSDVVMEDMNDDGLTDLIVSAYESLTISVFFRQIDGTFKTYPSLNLTTLYHPVSLRVADLFSNGEKHIVALERNPEFSDSRLVMYRLTSETTYDRWLDKSVWGNGIAFVINEFSGDVYLDIAVVCEPSNPQAIAGRLHVRYGPDFSISEDLVAGLGPRSIASADFDDDGTFDIAVGNYYSGSVMIFQRPFWFPDNAPAKTLTIPARPTSLLAGNFNGDALADLAVGTESGDSLRFYYQEVAGLPGVANLAISTPYTPSHLARGTINSDALDDILVLSSAGNVSFAHLRASASPFWRSTPDFVVPCGGLPRGAVIGDLDGDSVSDIAVASAREDWSGSSLAVYPSRVPTFSNSNATVWTRSDVETTSIAHGDIDGDDVVDLILVNPSNRSIDYVMSFNHPIETLLLGHSPERILVRDFDKDGADDVLVTMSDCASIVIAYGGSVFPRNVTELSCGGPITDVKPGDFNHDSYMDFVVSTYDGRLDFFFNDGSDSPFDVPYETIPSGGAGIWSIVVGDFNSDGLDDIAYPRPIRRISVLLQDVTIPFGPTSPSLTLTYPSGGDFTSLWSGDLNGDGKTDISAMRPSDVSMYLFDQDDFAVSGASYGSLTFPEEPLFVSVTDATDDGPADVLAIFGSADLVFLYKQMSGTLSSTPSMVFVTGAGPTCAMIGDGTRDHRGDLLVNNAGSSSVSVWQQVNFPPIAHSGGPYHAREGDALQLNGTSTTGTSEIPYMEYRWDFGDGNGTDWVREPSPIHTYFGVGTYTIAMDVRDPAGLLSSDSTYVVVDDSYPHVSFSLDPVDVIEGRLVNITDETTSYDPVTGRLWTINGEPFGDNAVISARFQNGSQEVNLTVTDSDGSSATLTKLIEVASVPPTLRIVAPNETAEGVEVEFVVLVDEWYGGPVDPIVSYEWDFSYVEGSFLPDPAAPSNASARCVFSTSSYWELHWVAVRVTDSDGMAGIEPWSMVVFDSTPAAGLSLNTSDPCEGVPFVFISNSTSHDGIVNWTWRLLYPGGFEEVFWLDDMSMALHEFDYLNDGDYIMQLTVREADGNVSISELEFHVKEMPPLIDLIVSPVPGPDGYYEEFTRLDFTCPAGGLDPGVLWEWDFDLSGEGFEADISTEVGSASHVYDQIGTYTAEVRVYDSDGSMANDSVIIRIKQKPLSFEIYVDITVLRPAPHTDEVFLNVSNLLAKHPDLFALAIEYGDGNADYIYGPDFQEAFHRYKIGRDYQLNITMVDDDGFLFSSSTVIHVDPPKVELIDPVDGAVIRSGTTILFLITPGSTPISSVSYNVNSEGFRPFASQYLINTTGWPDADYTISVQAWDVGGNMVVLDNVTMSIDDYPPLAVIYSEKTKVYAGSKFTITVWVSDRNVEATGVELHMMFPGDRVFLAYPMTEGDDGCYYREFEAPTTKGSIEFFAKVTDLAGNSDVTSLYSLSVKIRLLSVIWPYLLTASFLAVLGVAGYLVRETRIAVDETFVIHNDGRMISHSTRRLKPGMDDQVLSSMFTAIQDFVRESFKDITSFTLRKIEFGEKSVLIEKGRDVYLAVILHGHASRKVAAKMQRALDEIESKFDAHLNDWDGDLEKLRGINDITKKIYSKAPLLPRRIKG